MGQHVGVATQLVVRENLNINFATRFLANGVSRFFDADVRGVSDGNVICPLERDGARLRECGCACDGSRNGGGRQGTHKGAALDACVDITHEVSFKFRNTNLKLKLNLSQLNPN